MRTADDNLLSSWLTAVFKKKMKRRFSDKSNSIVFKSWVILFFEVWLFSLTFATKSFNESTEARVAVVGIFPKPQAQRATQDTKFNSHPHVDWGHMQATLVKLARTVKNCPKYVVQSSASRPLWQKWGKKPNV